MENPEKLDELAKELGSGDHPQGTDSGATERLDQWLNLLVEKGGSDLLMVEGAPPCVRVQGEVRKLEPASLDGHEIESAVLPALSQHALRLYRETLIADSSYRIEGIGRFRINLHRERGRAGARPRRFVRCLQAYPSWRSCICRRPLRTLHICRAGSC